MNPGMMIVGLALLWAGITGSFSGISLLFGAAIGSVAIVLVGGAKAQPRAISRLRQIVSLAVLFLRELAVSAVRVSLIVLTPNLKSRLRPAIVAFPLTVKSDAEITLLANLITLTPGTLSVDVSDDRAFLYVHALDVDKPEALIAEIANGFEARIRELFS